MRRTPLRRKPRRSRRTPVADESLARRFWQTSVRRGGCVMCNSFPVPRALREGRLVDLRLIEAHHVLAKRHLKRRGHAGRLWDTRNGMGLCRYHHERHENWSQRIPYELVPADAHEFAAELTLDWLVEREYPRAQSS
jgi:hypothetical protein